MQTYYEILGIQPDATCKEIKKAYHRLVSEHHPDRNLNNGNLKEATEETQVVNAAYEVLSDPDKRREYDDYLENLASRQQQERHHDANYEEEASEWERRKTDFEVVEEFTNFLHDSFQDYLREQQRRKSLGKKLASKVREGDYVASLGLVQQGAFLDEWSNEGYASIHYAIKNNSELLLKVLMLKGADVNTKSRDGKTALHCAIEFRCDHRIQALLISNTRRPDGLLFYLYSNPLDYQDSLKDTPLHLAVKTKQFETVRLLINAGAKTDLKDQNGHSAIDLMCEIYHELPNNLANWLGRKVMIQERVNNESNCVIM